MRIYRVSFHNNGKVYQLHAESVGQSDLWGFLEIADFLFDEHTSVVIDPSEEKLKNEFANVDVIYVPMHAVIRIDEVSKRGANKIIDSKGAPSNVMPFPGIPGDATGE
jgi:hypothetical protein